MTTTFTYENADYVLQYDHKDECWVLYAKDHASRSLRAVGAFGLGREAWAALGECMEHDKQVILDQDRFKSLRRDWYGM